ncbi:MAG: MFS transporter [Acidimicrobiia bacterium]
MEEPSGPDARRRPLDPVALRLARTSLGVAIFAVAFGTNVSTPLLLLYQQGLGLSAWTVTAIFAIYPLGLAPALLLAGPASDALGRRAIVYPGLLVSALASGVFIAGAESLPLLFLARLLLGAGSGLVFVVASAWMQELADPHDPLWPSRLTGLVLYAGFGLGPLVAGAIGEWGPAPLSLPYLVHLGVVGAGLVALRRVPETVTADPSRSIRPDLGIPLAARHEFVAIVVPTALGVFGFPSLAFGLFPVLLRPAMASIAVFVTGVVGAIFAVAIVGAQAVTARIGPYRSAPVGLGLGALGCGVGTVAVVSGLWPLLFVAAMFFGVASGCSATAGLRLVDLLTDPATRGALIGSFYAVAYGGMTMPVIVASVAGPAGFGAVLAGLTVLAGAGTLWLHRAVRRLAPPRPG